MLMPSIFRDNLFDDLFDFPFDRRGICDLMNTDIRDTEEGYELTVDMPGVKREDVKAQLKDGYLTIKASAGSGNEERDSGGRYIRRERYTGSCSRSFYVGEGVTQEDIRARFEDGILKLLIPKKEPVPEVEEKKYIAIEG